MPLNRAFIGREYPASATYEVGREHIRRFAEAIGDLNPAYLDVEAAKALGHRDVVAPPTFLTALGYRFAGEGPIVDPDRLEMKKFCPHDRRHTLHRETR